MRKSLLAGLLLVVAACGAPAPAQPLAGLTPSATAAPRPTPTASVGLTCRLPVSIAGTVPPLGGFIDFPAGTFTPDPASGNIGQGPASRSGAVAPGYYDRAVSRWLPVTREAVSPDGTHYAYSSTNDFEPVPSTGRSRLSIHVIDIATGGDAVFDGGVASYGGGGIYRIVDYSSDGIYLKAGGAEGSSEVLFLMNPNTGATRPVPLTGETWIFTGAANKGLWVGSVNPRDPMPWGRLGHEPDQIERLNLVDGGRVEWFYRPGSFVSVIGEDAVGHPIISVISGEDGQPTELLIAPNPGKELSVMKGPGIPSGNGSVIADSHGIWLGRTDGIYLYTEATGLRKVSSQVAYPANGCL